MSGYKITKIIHHARMRILTHDDEQICVITSYPVHLYNSIAIANYYQLRIIHNDEILYDIYKDGNSYLCYITFNKKIDYQVQDTAQITNPGIIQLLIELYELYYNEDADAELFADIINLLFIYRNNLIKLLDEVKQQDFSNIKNAN